MVNGRAVAMSAQEEAAIRAEWAASDAAPKPVPKPTVDDLLAVIATPQQQAAIDARLRAKP